MDEPPVVVRDRQIVPHEPCVRCYHPTCDSLCKWGGGCSCFFLRLFHMFVHFVFMFTLFHLFSDSEHTTKTTSTKVRYPPRTLYAQGGTCGLWHPARCSVQPQGQGVSTFERARSRSVSKISLYEVLISGTAKVRGSTAPPKAGQYYRMAKKPRCTQLHSSRALDA